MKDDVANQPFGRLGGNKGQDQKKQGRSGCVLRAPNQIGHHKMPARVRRDVLKHIHGAVSEACGWETRMGTAPQDCQNRRRTVHRVRRGILLADTGERLGRMAGHLGPERWAIPTG